MNKLGLMKLLSALWALRFARLARPAGPREHVRAGSLRRRLKPPPRNGSGALLRLAVAMVPGADARNIRG